MGGPVLNFDTDGPVKILPLTDKQALAYFKNKVVGGRLTYSWLDIRPEEHAAAFTAAKIMRGDILQVLFDGIEETIEQGGTVQSFRKSVRERLAKAGLSGPIKMVDPISGDERLIDVGSRHRLNRIYRTNLRTARAAGRWERIEKRAKRMPYLVYDATNDDRVRSDHLAKDMIILPVGHPFWQRWYPPNGWNCRCSVRQMSAAQIKRRGLQVTSDESVAKTRWDKTRVVKNKRTGETRNVPVGIDSGFDYNPGQSRLRALSPQLDGDETLFTQTKNARNVVSGKSYPLPKARKVSADDLLPADISDEAAVKIFLDTFGRGVVHDPVQVPLNFTEEAFKKAGKFKIGKDDRKRYFKVIAQAIKDPDEIWYEAKKTPAGKRYVARRMFVRFEVEGSGKFGIATFGETTDGNFAMTTFVIDRPSAADELTYLGDRVRIGNLLYKKNAQS